MTIVFSIASPHLIVMTADSAVTMDFGNSREYEKGRKSYFFEKVGCVTTWGVRDGNKIGPYLDQIGISPEKYSVIDLADLVFTYLTSEYKPHELDFDDVGYHIAGFDKTGQARLFHVFWGFDRPKPPEQTHREYKKYDHSPDRGGTYFLYNGRNDLAHIMIYTLLGQINRGLPIRFDLSHPIGLSSLGDFIARFAGELTPEVGPPFLTYLISPKNDASRIQNDSFSPFSQDDIAKELKELGYDF